MSLEKNPRIESLKAALKAAKKEVARIKQELAVVAAQAVEIPAEPVPEFVSDFVEGPVGYSDKVFVDGITEGSSGVVEGYLRAYVDACCLYRDATPCGYHWTAFVLGSNVPQRIDCFSADSWSEAVTWLRENFAKYSVLGMVEKAA